MRRCQPIVNDGDDDGRVHWSTNMVFPLTHTPRCVTMVGSLMAGTLRNVSKPLFLYISPPMDDDDDDVSTLGWIRDVCGSQTWVVHTRIVLPAISMIYNWIEGVNMSLC